MSKFWTCWRVMKRRKRTPEERARDKARYEETMSKLRGRIAYHKQKLAEERAAAERPKEA